MSGPLVFEFPPDPTHLRQLRRNLRRKLGQLGVITTEVDRVVLVVDEVVSNAIEHSDAYRHAGRQVRIRLEARGTDLLFEFVDPDVPNPIVDKIAQTLENSATRRPPLDNERGRGLFLLARHVVDLRVTAAPDGGLRMHGRFAAFR